MKREKNRQNTIEACKQLGRFLTGNTRYINHYPWLQHNENMSELIKVFCDADPTSCKRTDEHTPGVVMQWHGRNLTEDCVASSTAESELYVAVNGVIEGIDCRSMLSSMGINNTTLRRDQTPADRRHENDCDISIHSSCPFRHLFEETVLTAVKID